VTNTFKFFETDAANSTRVQNETQLSQVLNTPNFMVHLHCISSYTSRSLKE